MSRLAKKAFIEFREELKQIIPNLKIATRFAGLTGTPAHCNALGKKLYATKWSIISDGDVWVLNNYTKWTNFTKDIIRGDEWNWVTVTYENRNKILDFYRRLIGASFAEPTNNRQLCETLRTDIAKMEANLAEMKKKLNAAEHPEIKNVDRISNGVAFISKFGNDYDKIECKISIIDWFEEDIHNVRDKLSKNISTIDAYKKSMIEFKQLCDDCLAHGLEKFSEEKQ